MPSISSTDGDKRLSYIASAVSLCQIDIDVANSCVDRFCNDSNCLVLQIYVLSGDGDKNAVNYSNEIKNEIKPHKGIQFIKMSPVPLTPANLSSNILIISMASSPLDGLCNVLHQVYAPALLHDSNWTSRLDRNIQLQLSDLDKNLCKSILRGEGVSDNSGDNKNNFSGIIKVVDEFNYWEDKLRSIRERETADKFLKGLDSFARIKKINELPYNEVFELLEDVQNGLHEIWKANIPVNEQYSQARMIHLFQVIGNELSNYISASVSKIDVWRDLYTEVKSLLNDAIMVIDKWIKVTFELSSTFWSTLPNHTWTGGPFKDDYMNNLLKRGEEVLRIRTTHEELLKLLTKDQQDRLGVLNTFDPFKGLSPLQYNPFTADKWDSALASYESNLGPVEETIAVTLKAKLGGMERAPQRLRSFTKFSHLMLRKKISQQLSSERESLLAQLKSYSDSLSNDFDNRTAGESTISSGRNLSTIVNNIIFSKQLIRKFKSIIEDTKGIFSDLRSAKDFFSDVHSFISRCEQYSKEEFGKWSNEMTDAIDNGELGMEISGRLMEISVDGLLKVNYSERLVTLLRDVRQLSELGFSIPRELLKASVNGEKYYRFGVTLKKVANFYNSMGTQIIPTQRPILLDSLIQFENELKAKKKGGNYVSWNDPNECQDFVEKLQNSANNLSAENRKLRKVHMTMSDDVVGLMKIDLLGKAEAWKAKWATIKKSMSDQESKYSKTSLTKWKLHWDHQVYKALEAGYCFGLESLNENLPEIKCDLIFAKSQLGFKPSFEELRASYYKEMKKFVSIPNVFPGFGSENVYNVMSDRNGSSLIKVFANAEILFDKLENLKKSLEQWTALGQIPDIYAYVENLVTSVFEWDENLKMIKSKKKDFEKLPDFYKVDCFNVNSAPLKVAIEEQMQSLSDALISSLKKSTLVDIKEVDIFLTTSMEKLNTRPHSIEEISLAKKEWGEISENSNKIKRVYDSINEKKTLLFSVAPIYIDTSEVSDKMSVMPSRWENFSIALEAYNDLIEEQRTALRGQVEKKVSEKNNELNSFSQRWTALKPRDVKDWSKNSIDKIFTELEEWQQLFAEIKQQCLTLIDNCEYFGMPPAKFDTLAVTEEDMILTQASWAVYKSYSEGLLEMAKVDWITFRVKLYDLSDFVTKWSGEVKGKTKDVVCNHIYDDVERIKKALPALKFCKGDVPFNDEHWNELFRKLKIPKGVRIDNLTLGHFLEVSETVSENLNFCKNLTSRATGEVRIREAMSELKAWTSEVHFTLIEHDELGRSTPLISDWKELFTALGDNMSLLASLKDSPYFKPFEAQALVYETDFSLLDHTLTGLNQIQRRWLYLEPIFGRGSLPSQQDRFKRVDNDFRQIVLQLQQDTHVFSLADATVFPQLRENVDTMLDQLERCQKALSDFLEEKRSKMPRFYFIGDDDLLEILGQAQNAVVIQSHLKKLFQGLYNVDFNANKKSIIAMKSVAKEAVTLSRPVEITDKVENWLDSLANEMKNTLAKSLVDCLNLDQSDVNIFSSQILQLTEQIRFTTNCENAIKNGTLKKLSSHLKETLNNYVSIDLSEAPLVSLKVKALVLDIIHYIDVVDYLLSVEKTGLDVNSWPWQKQLRFYLSNDICISRMVDACIDYTYEYQGNAPKLVHTPLTDKCYLTLTQGMHQGYGGNPYGPAGTGKTESVKALGQALGRQVLVFNCDEGIDFQSMGRIFIGLTKCGAWGCFDEFNRLKEDQLSAVSQQIQVIQDAIKFKKTSIQLLGRTIDVNFNAGIFVTLNPAGKGYGGRSKLPDNLKQLFRPISMSSPDNELIAEVVLYSEGFTDAKNLGNKMVSLYSLCKQLLTKQQHYDWGLRAMKAVLVTGGRLIQNSKAEKIETTNKHQQDLLIKAIRVNTLSKLTYGDSKRFLSLIQDVFPGASTEDISYKDLEKAIKEVMENKPFNLEHNEIQVKKMLQLKESLDQRMGCVVVGPSGCGKSALWRVLKAAMVKCGQPVVTHVMNPKSMPRQQLLGHMDLDTREWNDGVLTAAARQVVKEPLETRSWIVCDGDVDPEWIESLNSVLDDNHLLTLPNGERISFGANVNFLFETHDLSFASPATISRMGMIFLSEEDVDVSRLVRNWLREQNEDIRSSLAAYVENFFYKALEWVNDQTMMVETTLVGTVLNGLSHIANVSSKGEFVVGLIRGLGANLNIVTRTAFAKHVYNLTSERPVDISVPLDCYYKDKAFVAYESQDAVGNISRKDLENGTAVVQTISVQKNIDMIYKWVEKMEPFILVGPEGAGKSMILNYIFSSFKSTSVTTLNCNAQTTAANVIQKLHQSCSLFSTNNGRVFRPREGERLVLYLKDINLPKPDMYNTCMLVAFLQQLITFKGFYDDKREFLGIEKIHIVCSMNAATTVGRHPLSSRFTAIVRIAYIDYPDSKELVNVYSSYLAAALGGATGDSKWSVDKNITKLASTLLEVYDGVKSKFSVDEHRHYLFTPRDVTDWVLGLLRYDLKNENLLDIVAYEGTRLFRDRLVDGESEKKFDLLFTSILRNAFKHTVDFNDVYFTSLNKSSGNVNNKKEEEGKSEEKSNGKEKKEKEVAVANESNNLMLRISVDDFKNTVSNGIMLFEREERELNIQLFKEVLDHISRVDRVLSKRGGSLLLVGLTGVGRRVAVTLTAHMHRMTTHSPNVTRGYNIKNFYADLKIIFAKTGINDDKCVLFLEDYHFVDDSILETINSLLSSGEVPGLYSHEELEPLLSPLKEAWGEMGGSSVYRTTYDYFISRIRNNLHVVLSMDHTHPLFLSRCGSNPALYTDCEILWMGSWNKSSMMEIPRLLLADLINKSEDKEYLLKCMYEIHSSVAVSDGGNSLFTSNNLATPRDFITFLNTYNNQYNMKNVEVELERSNLMSGLTKLQEASKTVDSLSSEAVGKRSELSEKQVAADKAMVMITETLTEAATRKSDVEKLQGSLAIEQKKTNERKADIERELSEIQPILDSAKEAVSGIKQEHLREICSLKTPPEAIMDVLGAVLTLLNVPLKSWSGMQSFLKGRGVKEDILNYDAHSMTADIRKDVSKEIKKKASSFEQENIYRVSVAAAPLAAWVKANVRYSLVLEKIQPLQDELDSAVRSLKKAQIALEENERELNTIDDRVKTLKNEFQLKTTEAEKLRFGLENTEKILGKAQSLLDKLGGEQKRWEQTAKRLGQQLSGLPMQMLLSAAYTTYLGKAAEDVRRNAIVKWSSICNVEGFNYMKILSTESQLLTWKASGLPSDELSMQNAIIILQSTTRTPFIIDPAQIASSWLKRYIKDDKNVSLEIIASQDGRFQNQVELAVRFGKTLIVTEVDGVEPMLYPLVRKDFTMQGPRLVVQIGEKSIDFNEKFKLIMITRNPSPDIPPDAKSVISEINFSVTRSGLEGQLLGATIQHEQPELEKMKSSMLQREEQFKVQLAGLEKDLLQALATSSGNLLENQILIDSLTATKVKSAEITLALKESADASEEIDKQREGYRPFGHNASKLFFLVQSLQKTDHMYQFSLSSFMALFELSLKENIASSSVNERVALLTPSLEKRVLLFVSRSLFKADRLLWAIHLIHGMHDDIFEENEWDFFVGNIVPLLDSRNRDLLPNWAPAERGPVFSLLADTFPRLIAKLNFADAEYWKRWSRSPEAERDWPNKLNISIFQKLIIIQTLRPDRLQSAMLEFICSALKIDSVSPASVSLSNIYEKETKNHQPILMITSTGADPCKELSEFAESKIGSDKYFELAMGGGQTDIALSMLKSAAAKGDWLCLKNLHLVVAWLPILEKELNSLNMHDNFRLWLTTEPHHKFPPILLQSSLKITFESPPGIRKNLARTFSTWDPTFFENGSIMRSQALFTLAWTHALLQERRTYMPQGWSEFYEFSIADLRSAVNVLEVTLNDDKRRGTPWPTIHGLMESALYGGRISNPHDNKVLQAYLNLYFNDIIISGKSSVLNRNISLPNSNRYADYVEIINNLPDTDSPSMFGLPLNIERSVQRANSSNVITQLRNIAAVSIKLGAFDKEIWRTQLSPILDIWTKLLDSSKRVLELPEKLVKGNGEKETPIQSFVILELSSAHKLVKTVNDSLQELQKVLFGSGLLSPAIQSLGAAFLSGRIPEAWEKVWEGPDKAPSWLRGLVVRKLALLRWSEDVNDNVLFNKDINLSDLFNPGTFLNAFRQQTARQSNPKTAMDDLRLISSWSSSGLPSLFSIKIKGLFLQGAVFDGKGLIDAAADGNELEGVPSVHIAYVPSKDVEKYASSGTMKVPVYYSTTRERILSEILVPCGSDSSRWILSGVALFLSEPESSVGKEEPTSDKKNKK